MTQIIPACKCRFRLRKTLSATGKTDPATLMRERIPRMVSAEQVFLFVAVGRGRSEDSEIPRYHPPRNDAAHLMGS